MLVRRFLCFREKATPPRQLPGILDPAPIGVNQAEFTERRGDATKNAAPTLVIHGDQDKLVPIEQSKTLIAKLTDCGVECELMVKQGKGHGWFGIDKDLPTLADWFDKHILDKK